MAALAKAKAADELSRNQASASAALVAGLRAAERARRAAPGRVVEEALLQHLARVVRQLIPVEDRPDAAQWPLAGLPIPPPALPPLEDPRLGPIEASIDRSLGRIRSARARLAGILTGVAPLPAYGRAQLRAAVRRMEVEHRILVDQRRTTLEEILNKEASRPPIYSLHLANAYFFLDAHHDKRRTRRKRGLKVLGEIRRDHPNDVAAGIAALSFAGFALDDGDATRARRLLDVAGPFDPGLSNYMEALLHWRAGDHTAALRYVRTVRGPLSASLTAHLGALEGVLSLETGDPAAAAKAWQRAMNYAPPPFAERARLNAAVAFSEAVSETGEVERVPSPLARSTLGYALTQGRLEQATRLLARIRGDNERDLPHLTFMVIDGLRAAGAHRRADQLLALASRRYGTNGPWRAAFKGPLADWVSRELLTRIDARLGTVIAEGVLVSPEVRAVIEPLVTARLELFPLAETPRLELLTGLGAIGFFRRVRTPMMALIEHSTQPDQRRAAARALVDAAVLYAREHGVKGATLGPWLDGRPYAPPRHASVDEVLSAQGQLIGLLPFRSVERDKLVLDRAAIRIAIDELGDTVKELEDVVSRRLDTRIGLRGTYLLLAAQPERAAELAGLYASRHPGPPARLRALKRSLDAVFAGRPRTKAYALLGERKYAEAAAQFEVELESADGDSAVGAGLGAAVAWCLGLRAARAELAFRSFVERFPSHPQTTVVQLHLARLLHAQGRRQGAARAYEAFTRQLSDSRDGAKALLRAIELYKANESRLYNAVGRFIQRYPENPATAELRVRSGALDRQRREGTSGPLSAPEEAGACRGRACQQARFWPR